MYNNNRESVITGMFFLFQASNEEGYTFNVILLSLKQNVSESNHT